MAAILSQPQCVNIWQFSAGGLNHDLAFIGSASYVHLYIIATSHECWGVLLQQLIQTNNKETSKLDVLLPVL